MLAPSPPLAATPRPRAAPRADVPDADPVPAARPRRRTSHALGQRAASDLLWVLLLCLAAFAVGVRLEVFERMTRALHEWEVLQADEAMLGLFVLCLGSTWFAFRRWREAAAEAAERRQAQAEVAALLARNRELLDEVVQVQERERAEIGRELHDELGQLITALRVETSALDCFVARSDLPACADSLATLRRLSESMHQEVRDLLRRVRPWGLEELGLAAVVQTHVQGWQRQHGIACTLTLDGEGLAGLPAAVATTAYRLVQEGLTNVARHARAQHVRVSLALQPPAPGAAAATLAVRIADDGAGCEPAAEGRGLGLVGMRERVRMLGGEWRVHTAPGQGYEMAARLPVARHAH